MPTESNRITVYYPRPVVDDLRALVPRGKRTAFIIAATERELRRLELLDAMEKSAGAWKDEDYPELATEEDIDRWIHGLRASWRPAKEWDEDA